MNFFFLFKYNKLIKISWKEIVNILKNDIGGFLCTNCHSVLDMEYLRVIDKIFDNEKICEKTRKNYLRVKKNFNLISDEMIKRVGNPLKKDVVIRGSYIKYLGAIYKLSKKGSVATNKTISNLLNIKYAGVKTFFLRRREFLEQYVNFDFGRPTQYSLNIRGTKLVSLINYFRNYYCSLEFDKCENCIFNKRFKCIATQPNQCPIIVNGNNLPFQF